MVEVTYTDSRENRYTEIQIEGVKDGAVSYDEKTGELVVRGYEDSPTTEVLYLPQE